MAEGARYEISYRWHCAHASGFEVSAPKAIGQCSHLQHVVCPLVQLPALGGRSMVTSGTHHTTVIRRCDPQGTWRRVWS